jgi:gamma-glutamyltranspeptidase/glutathione hydrolase
MMNPLKKTSQGGRFTLRSCILLAFITAAVGCAQSPQVVLEDREPEAATGVMAKNLAVGEQFMVAAANPHAANAGKRIIEQGGSAIDAAIAIQAMLTLVEPQSSGIGGGGFILYWDNTAKQLYTFDGREVAPQKITPDVFIKNGEPMKWRDAVVGGKAVGVPGILKALEDAHAQFGTLPWSQLFDDSINLSNTGFKVSPRLATLIELDLHPGLNEFAQAQAYFKPNGKPLAEGELRKNKKLASTLTKIAQQGTDAFYTGEIARNIVNAVNEVSINPGKLSAADLAQYTAIQRQPMCSSYRVYEVCSMAPPSSGGVTMMQILKLLEGFTLSDYAPESLEFAHLFAQASALAFADRADYVADLSFMGIDAAPLVDADYLRNRAATLGTDVRYTEASSGRPYGDLSYASDDAFELDSTSHIAIVDKQGNAVSMTSSIEFMFGSGIMVDGFLLNNQLTDFAINPIKDGVVVLNAAAPGKRPRSAMSPTMVFTNDGELNLIVGSPGGSRIINYVAQTIINVLDFNLDIQESIDVARITNRNDFTSLEKGTNISQLKAPLEALGHTVRVVDLNSGLHGIQIENGKLLGGADPRREGIAIGK